MVSKLYLHLKDNKVDVYFPGQKKGLCEKSYVVVKDSGQYAMAKNKTGYSTISVIIFCPIDRYSQIGKYKKLIKDKIKEFKNIVPTGFESATLIDDKVKAFTTYIEYRVLKKL